MSLEHCNGVFFWPSLLRIALNVARTEAWLVSEALCSLRWCVGVYPIFMESCIINF